MNSILSSPEREGIPHVFCQQYPGLTYLVWFDRRGWLAGEIETIETSLYVQCPGYESITDTLTAPRKSSLT